MKLGVSTAIVMLVFAISAAGPAMACGFGEAPGDCGQTPESEARYMLLRVATAIKADEPKALGQFQRGENGFRTQESYVFCVDPNGIMSVHPSPALQGHDVRDLHDPTGNYFIATMMKTAEQGKVREIRYLFPRPGSTIPVPKTTYYTRASDQVCGVGVYDGDTNPAPAAPAVSREARLAQLRTRLSSAMPAGMNADWTEFLRLTDEQTRSQEGAITKAREQVQAIQTTLASAP